MSCKDSKKSNSDKKAKVEQPAPQPLPEIPHSDNPEDREPNDGNQNPGFSEVKQYVHVSRKFCLKVIHGKYIPSLCHDFDPYKDRGISVGVVQKKAYRYPSNEIGTYSAIRMHIQHR